MKALKLSICVFAVINTGCATVDLQSMTGSSNASGDAVSETVDQNIVQRSVERLRSAFASRGLDEKSSEKKMHRAANLLLKGLSAMTASTDQTDGYADTPKPVSVILDDVRMAEKHVSQTRDAAEIYLELLKPDQAVDDELKSLQAALLVSERAARLFSEALNDASEPDLETYKTSVEGLRRVTNEFGVLVRTRKSGKPQNSSGALITES